MRGSLCVASDKGHTDRSCNPVTLCLVESQGSRPLTNEQRSVLNFLLAVQFAGVDALREQARHTREAGGEPCPCGCPSFGLTVDRSLAGAAVLAFDVPVVVSSSYEVPGGAAGGDLMLFQVGGWLDAVEVTWYGEEPPSSLPALSLCGAPEPDPRLLWDPSRVHGRRSTVGPWHRLRRRVDGVLLRHLARHS